MDLPFRSHPLYSLRIAIISSAVLGMLLCFGCLRPWGCEPFETEIGVLGASSVVSAAELYYYARQKKDHPDQDPKWPDKKWILGDAVLAFALLLSFAASVVAAGSYCSGYHFGDDVIPAYAALCALVCSYDPGLR